MIEMMGISRGYQPLSFNQNRNHLLQYLPLSQDELPVRSMEVPKLNNYLETTSLKAFIFAVNILGQL